MDSDVLLDLWHEYRTYQDRGRLWLVQSGDAIVLDDKGTNALDDVTLSQLTDSTESLNKMIRRNVTSGRWPEGVTVEGKMVFYHDWRHHMVAMIRWENGAFWLEMKK